MSQVNLLPPEIRERQRTRRLTSVVALAGVVVLAGIAFLYGVQVLTLSQVHQDLEAQEAVNRALQAEVASLQRFADLRAELEEKQALVGEVFANEVSWSGALLDVSRLIPDDAYLTGMTAQITAATGQPEVGEAGGQLVGTISFDGVVADIRTLADWLTRLEGVRGWENAWTTNATETAPFSGHYTFSSGVDLSVEAVTRRGAGGTP
jgi:Tfp pilus assembly protein PilN